MLEAINIRNKELLLLQLQFIFENHYKLTAVFIQGDWGESSNI